MKSLTDGQRDIVLALDNEWRPLADILERVYAEAQARGARPLANRRVEAILMDALDTWADYARRRHAQSLRECEHYRLSMCGQYVQSEARLVRREQIRLLEVTREKGMNPTG